MTQKPYIGSSHKQLALADLHDRIRTRTLPKLAALLKKALDMVDDALFGIAEKVDSNAEQARYFDGMREVRHRRGDIEHRFQERLVESLVAFSEGRARRNTQTRQAPGRKQPLSLIENEELEQSLAVVALVSRAESKLGPSLYALNRRLAEITGGTAVDEENNPLAPAALASAFRFAIETLECTLETRLVLLKLFDRLVINALDPIYDELNKFLIAAGVLPRIPMAAARTDSSTPPLTAASNATSTPRQADQADNGKTTAGNTRLDSPFADEVYRSIYTLMAAHRIARRYAAQSKPKAANDTARGRDEDGRRVVINVGVLLNALTLLQSELDNGSSAPENPTHVKHRLFEQIARIRADTQKSRMLARDEHSIDLVGMVFDYILQDPNLPPPIQVLLVRLQIPYIKVALLDPQFFALRSHPARRLLDELSQAGIGWSEASDPDRRLYKRIAEVVDMVLHNFDDNLALFDRLLVDFRDFIAIERRRAEIAEQRAAEATRGRERLLSARRRAAREVLERVRGRDLPRTIHTILTRPWANFLVLTLLRHGEDSQVWEDALRFADDLVWAAEPKPLPEDRKRLLLSLPKMDRMLRHGLSTVAYHDSDIQMLCAELDTLLKSHADPDTSLGKRPVEAEVDFELPGEPLVQALDSSLEDTGKVRGDSASPLPLEDAWVQRARDLAIGTWVEFLRNGAPNERARLSWISPVSGRKLFVNHKGLKVCDRSPEQLAGELASGNATVLDSSALVDRALAAILDQLRAQPVSN